MHDISALPTVKPLPAETCHSIELGRQALHVSTGVLSNLVNLANLVIPIVSHITKRLVL